MSLDIAVVTSTPAALATFLEKRGILQSVNGQLVGVLPGVEFTVNSVPNLIQTQAAQGTPGQVGYDPPVYDTRKVYLVRLSAASDAADDDGSANPDRFTRSKLAQWVVANSTPVTLTSAEGASYQTREVGTTVWVVLPASMARFGAWQ